MRRFLGSALVAMILGISLGVYLGWEQFPVEYRNNPMCQLSDEYKEDYTLMIARGFRADTSLNASDTAWGRLLPLLAENDPDCLRDDSVTQITNIAAWVQEVTERYRSESAPLQDICDMATLSRAFGRPIPGLADGSNGDVCTR